MTSAPIFIADYSVACALGADRAEVMRNLFAGAAYTETARLVGGREIPVGRLPFALMGDADETRTNWILAHVYAPLAAQIEQAKARYGAHRVGVVIGTSTSGIGEAGEAIKLKLTEGRWPSGFSLRPQLLGDTARYLALISGAEGPAYTVSTACTSGAKALAAAGRMLRADVCDVVIAGGVDSLCDLTINGFAALDSISDHRANPMSANRNGIHIGEGGGLFIVTREAGPYRLAGWGESSDAHHMSAPDPTGAGAELAWRRAMTMAGGAGADYAHLHGTATKLNDAMEAGLIDRVLGRDIPTSSTKGMTGHTLGAAGAVQAAFCLMALETEKLPPHVWDGVRDPDLPPIRLAEIGETAALKHVMSASYAFGGNNCALILALG
ncbi:MAG: beta-ketoacyl-ACP synthase [Caulobacterales bacterium]